MYCQFCGTEVTQELNYCKRCGGVLNAPSNMMMPQTRPIVSGGAIWGVGLTTFAIVVLGLVTLLTNLFDLVDKGLPPVAVVWIALFCTLTIFGSVALLIRLWSRFLGVPEQKTLPGIQLKRPITQANELNSGTRFNALPDRGTPVSVTENTTRTLEQSYKESQH